MIHCTERLDEALRVAATAHEKQGQHRKGSDAPYIIHPVSVMLLAAQATDDEDVLIACLLHDVLEDVDDTIYSETDMGRDFGERVLGFVKDVTKNDDIHDWHERSKAYLAHLGYKASDESLIISAADKIHNLQSVITDYKRVGDDIWQIFSTKSGADQLWWYESILEVLQKRQVPSVLTNQLEDKVAEIKALMRAGQADFVKVNT